MYRSDEYLEHIRSMPCCICSKPPRSEPHHFAGRRGMGIKADDLYTVPLCTEHHREWHDRARIGHRTKAETMAEFWKAATHALVEWIKCHES